MSAFADFPPDEILIARGKFSTLGSEKRMHLKLLRDDMETLGRCARNILNGAQEPSSGMSFAEVEFVIAEERVRAAKIRLAALAELEPQLEKLKPLAWGKKGADNV